MAVLGHVADHRLERLRVAVVVVLVDELDAPESAHSPKRRPNSAEKMSVHSILSVILYAIITDGLSFGGKVKHFFAE